MKNGWVTHLSDRSENMYISLNGLHRKLKSVLSDSKKYINQRKDDPKGDEYFKQYSDFEDESDLLEEDKKTETEQVVDQSRNSMISDMVDSDISGQPQSE